MNSQGFPAVPEMLGDEKEHRRQMATMLNRLNQGKANVQLDVPVTPGATTTTITDPRISVFSVLTPAMAFDAAGAADIAAGIYFNTLNNGSAVMHHRNNGSTRTLRISILG